MRETRAYILKEEVQVCPGLVAFRQALHVPPLLLGLSPVLRSLFHPQVSSAEPVVACAPPLVPLVDPPGVKRNEQSQFDAGRDKFPSSMWHGGKSLE